MSKIALVTLVLSLSALFAPAAVVVSGSSIRYELTATFDDGAEMSGTFTLDLSAPNTSSVLGRGSFEMQDLALNLSNTTLFSGQTSGFVTELTLSQNPPGSPSGSSQSLFLELSSDDGLSGAFGVFEFSPFTTPADELNPIEAPFLSGFLDGSGTSNVVTFNLAVIPEPGSSVLLLLGGALFVSQRWKR